MPGDTQISWYTNSASALEWAASHHVDLALLDIDMPGMSGLELAQKLKSLDPDTAVIFLTGYSQYAVEAIKKQQEASIAQGYAKGGFTPKGNKYEVAGVVHKGEWVASQELLSSPVARPMIEALDYAQRTNAIGSLRAEDVSRSIVAPSVYAQSAPLSPTVIVQSPQSESTAEIAATYTAMKEYAAVIRQLKERLDEPFVTVNTVTGDNGIRQAEDEYEQLIRNKTPKSRRK